MINLSVHVGVVLAALLPAIAINLTGPAAVALEAPLIVTQIPSHPRGSALKRETAGLTRSDWFAGARLAVVSPDGSVSVLSKDFEAACDPNLSFDGTKVLFAGKKDRDSAWRIWEIGVDGQGLRVVSPETLEARSPIYVSTLFTLDSPEPWFTAVFVGSKQGAKRRGDTGNLSLYNLKLDGTELRRLTFSPHHSFDPFQTRDGRVIYSAECYSNEPGPAGGRVGLFGIHVEGADVERYGGGPGGRIQHMACATERGLIVFVETDEPSWDGAGQLACVRESRPHVDYRRLTADADHVFLYPSPLRANQLLVSRRSTDGAGTCGVFCFDADDGRCAAVYDSPEFHEVQAVTICPRPRPDGHSTVVNPKVDHGTLYGLNCYLSDEPRERHLKQGEIKRVRFIEGVAQTPASPLVKTAPGEASIARRLVGEAPVEPDGSFNVEVPADTPLLVQALDERGLALGTSGWLWVKPKETRGCIGCHEDPELIPENEYVLALRRPSNRLLLPPAQRRSVTFRTDIVPILQKHCAAADCHGGKDTPLHLPLTAREPGEEQTAQAYEALTVRTDRPAQTPRTGSGAGKYVDQGRARTSWLVWQTLGSNTARPWDQQEAASDAAPRKVTPMPPRDRGVALGSEELRTLIQWIDLGAPFQAPPPAEPAARNEREAQ